ncbi:hypothetical protein NQ318_022201 [Aromia moschata]|uniref:DNA-directed RNA polymerase III subunit RPC8 n=1 Tax=Aromia moschata TaxID=1265417 RepID=A0AAV8Z655_9CUCU|nr:hypothetical protein NQ318_022201 [Aromia moschata]
MFILAEMKNVTRIPPELFNQKLNDAIAGELNKKLANKVVLNVGLCIALFDILSLQESFIFPGDGASHTRALHRRDIDWQNKELQRGRGVHVTLGFFDDILIPPSALQHPSKFNETEQVWVWEYNSDDGKVDLFMDAGESIRFRVTAEMFNETCPTGPATIQESQENPENKVPYSLTGSINEPGLGLLSWWDNQ